MAEQNSPRWGTPYPQGEDAPDVPYWMEKMALALDDRATDDQGLEADRPVSTVQQPGKRGRYYFATDTGRLWRDNGAGWDEIPIGAGQRAEPGDLKYALKGASHGVLPGGLFAWLLADGSEVPAGYTALIAELTSLGSPFGIGPNGRPRLPDFRGRVPVAQGIHSEVDRLGDSDGLTDVAKRKIKHRHGRGTLTISAAGEHRHNLEGAGNVVRDELGSGVTWGYVSLTPTQPQYRTEPRTELGGIHSHDMTGEVGDTAGPLDGPAFLVGGNWFVKT